MFAALVVSVVAEGAKLVPLVLVQVIALLPEVVQSPLISEDFLHGRQHFRDSGLRSARHIRYRRGLGLLVLRRIQY
jgi:hypothetical protein